MLGGRSSQSQVGGRRILSRPAERVVSHFAPAISSIEATDARAHLADDAVPLEHAASTSRTAVDYQVTSGRMRTAAVSASGVQAVVASVDDHLSDDRLMTNAADGSAGQKKLYRMGRAVPSEGLAMGQP